MLSSASFLFPPPPPLIAMAASLGLPSSSIEALTNTLAATGATAGN